MHGSVADGHRLAKVSPPDQQLSALRLIRTVIRNPIETWPKPVYEKPLYRSRFLGREIVFVMEPDLIRQVLVDQADAFVKAESLRRALQPLLGDAILTTDGARWRWQQRGARIRGGAALTPPPSGVKRRGRNSAGPAPACG